MRNLKQIFKSSFANDRAISDSAMQKTRTLTDSELTHPHKMHNGILANKMYNDELTHEMAKSELTHCKKILGVRLPHIKSICSDSLPIISVASASAAKLVGLILFPLNLAIWIVNLALLFTMVNR